MNITQFAIDKKVITTVALVLIFLAGFQAYTTMPRAEDPGFVVRQALVTTVFPGAGPERVEQLVTDKLEKAIQEIPTIDFLTSTSKPGISVITVSILESEKVMRPIWDDLRRKVDRARGELPDGIRGPIVNDEFGDVFGTIVTITGEDFTYAELKDIADDARNELLLIREVAKVDIVGDQEERIFIEFNNARLAELGISAPQLQQILRSRNIIFPGGEIFTENEQIVLEPSGNFESVEELRQTIISIPGRSGLLYLGDIATVNRAYVDPAEQKIHFNAMPTLALAISLREGGNVSVLGEKVKQQVQRFREVFPHGVDFDFIAYQPFYVNKKVNDVAVSILQSIGIVILVMLFTLGFRTGLVVSSLIPMAIVSAILVMSFVNIGLDQISLAALIIALGMLVDNAIVMSESILVQIGEGKKPMKAAVDSAKELRIPLLTSSLTTAAAFLPIYLAKSTTGEYTAPLFEVVTITLLCSWLLSLTMTPLLCMLFLKVKSGAKEESYNSRFYRAYRSFLLSLVKRPLLSLAGTIVIFFIVLQGLGFVPNIFFPPNEKPIMYAELTLPVGTPFARTEEIVGRIDAFIRDSLQVAEGSESGGVVSWASFIGSGAPRYILSYGPEPPSPEYAYMIINCTDVEAIENRVIQRLEQFCFNTFPSLITNIRRIPLGPPVKSPVEIRVSGKETDAIFALVDKVKAHLAEIPGAKNIKDNWGARSKKLLVNVDEARALRAGLTNQDIAVSLQTILSGLSTTDYREGDKVIPVVLRSEAADRKDAGKLESHDIFSSLTGQSVPLKQVADVEVVWQPAKILRRDRLKTVAVQADVIPGANAIAIAEQMDAWLQEDSKNWEVGYKYELGGEIESSGKAAASIGAQVPVAFLIIILLLVGQFNSVRKPLIILLTIPLGLIGVTIGLLVCDSYLGFMTQLGIIALAGIVINNAIVLLDRIQIEIEVNGLDANRAVIEAAQRRLRPILLTTATTIGGLLPLWVGGGGPMFIPLAIAIIFGILFATVLTLGFVPVLYTLFFRVKFKGFQYSD